MNLTVKKKEHIIRQVHDYVHSCRVDDGGFFFARIPPGSLLDTYFAIMTLSMTGSSPLSPNTVKQFTRQHIKRSSANDIHAWCLASEIFVHLDHELDLRSITANRIPSMDLAGLTSKPASLYIEVSSEIQRLFEYVSLFRNLHADTNKRDTEIAEYIHFLRNDDGGYGLRRSSLATTYYAVKILSLLNETPGHTGWTLEYLERRGKSIYFLEDLFYFVNTSVLLDKEKDNQSDWIEFVLDCQRASGGFARARAMGIATLEYTYYAVSILANLGFFTKAMEG